MTAITVRRGPYTKTQARIAAFIEDVEWLVQQGECVAAICQHLHANPEAISRRLVKHDRRDLANYFWGYR